VNDTASTPTRLSTPRDDATLDHRKFPERQVCANPKAKFRRRRHQTNNPQSMVVVGEAAALISFGCKTCFIEKTLNARTRTNERIKMHGNI
jgi:hypothetical protein